MKKGNKFRKKLIKFVQERVYLWDLRYPNENSNDTIICRFIHGKFINVYRDNETGETLDILDQFKGDSFFIQIYCKMEKMNNVDAFLLARKICVGNKKYKIECKLIIKELR